ncbi:MAG: flagellar hook-associated protein 3 [Pusillimonas sp.]|nr:flagellar hook-associated protein 3 [Pusillimonas sp.]MBC41921.1 flagellar hook-associated protein 3 [Pusillimonas sp.]HCP77800.1 flagellar hook-associated protein 3 [Pusillimonas sp.]|tara:strand:- start:45 stop:1595 length:1551 start_codon:yes stop_codon:yes gene_type:complete
MRISSNLFFETGMRTINLQQADLMHLYQQVGTGRRMITPADDPLAAAQTINIAQSQSLNERYADNREVAKTQLGMQENTLDSASTLLQGIKTRLVEAGNGTLSDADRGVLANVLQNAKDNLLGLANATDGNGQYLFSGYSGSRPPFIADSFGAVSYQGDEGRRLIQIDQTRQLDSADTGSAIFTKAAPGARDYITHAATGNEGTAIIGKPVIGDPKGQYVGAKFELSFTEAGDGSMEYSVTVRDAGGYVLSGPSVPTAYDESTETLALPGGVQVGFSGMPADGDAFSVEPVFVTDPFISAQQSAAGTEGTAVLGKPGITDPTGEYMGKQIDVAFQDNAGTLQYQLTVDGTTGPWVDYTDPGPGGVLDLGGGLEVAFEGVPNDGYAFSVEPVEPSTDLNVFNALDDIIASLKTPVEGDPAANANYQNVLASAMQRLDVNFDQVQTVISSVGTRLNEIDAIDANSGVRELSYAQDLQRLEEVDHYEAISQLQLRSAALDAALMAFKKIQATSMFNLQG